MSVVTSIEDIGPCRKRLAIEVPGAAVEAETDRVVREFRRQARIPGFRKGKVPTDVVKSRYRDDIRQELIDRLVPRYWRQAETESQLDPLLPPSVEEVEVDAGSSLSFVATVEVRPELDVDYNGGFELPELEVEPTDEEIDDTLEGLRRQLADLEPVERAAAKGDVVTAQMQEIMDSAADEAPVQPVTVEVGDAQVWEELSAALEGAAADSEVGFSRVEPDGSERRFRGQVAVVKEVRLQELDDEFAAKVGKFETLEALRRDIGLNLRGAKLRERSQRREGAVIEQLRERHPIDLPQGVVEHEVRGLLREYAEGLAHRGFDPSSDIDWEDIATRMRPQAESRVHGRLLLDAVGDAEQVEVPEEELEEALAAIARSEGQTTVQVRQALDSSGRMNELRAQLRRQKILGRLLGGEEEPPRPAASEVADAEAEVDGEVDAEAPPDADASD